MPKTHSSNRSDSSSFRMIAIGLAWLWTSLPNRTDQPISQAAIVFSSALEGLQNGDRLVHVDPEGDALKVVVEVVGRVCFENEYNRSRSGEGSAGEDPSVLRQFLETWDDLTLHEFHAIFRTDLKKTG